MSTLTDIDANLTELLSSIPSDSLFALREEAADVLREKGIPSKRHEDWKYTNVKRLFDNGLTASNSAGIVVSTDLGLQNCVTVSLNNASVSGNFPTMEGVSFHTLTDAGELFGNIGKSGIHTIQEMAALNTALFNDLLIIYVGKNIHPEQTLIIEHGFSTSEAELFNSRILFVLEQGSKLNCVHHFHGKEVSEKALLNHLTEAFVASNASLELNVLQELGTGNLVNTTEVEVAKDGRFTTNTVQLSGKLLRNNLNVRLAGSQTEANLNGFYMLDGRDLFDNHTIVDHLMPYCQSNETYKGLLGGHASGVFNGKVHVHRDAQQTNAYQQNKNILLSDTATMNSKPELEIYADDVKCSHGSTTGQLDEDAVFYLRSRGLSQRDALSLLLTAFAADVLDGVSDAELRSLLERKVQNRLSEME